MNFMYLIVNLRATVSGSSVSAFGGHFNVANLLVFFLAAES
jgi:hypothetical protein